MCWWSTYMMRTQGWNIAHFTRGDGDGCCRSLDLEWVQWMQIKTTSMRTHRWSACLGTLPPD